MNVVELTFLEGVFVFFMIGFSGFIDSIAGGGGLISVPTYLSIGLPPHFLLGTNKLVSTCGGTIAAFRYARSGRIQWRVTGVAMASAFSGALLGASMSGVHTSNSMTYLLLVIVPIMIFINLIQDQKKRKTNIKKDLSSYQYALRALSFGLLIGFYDGFYGPGTGSFLIMAFLFLIHL